MAHDTLFDGRYRYDHIYPRGRSGEALRAYDTQNDDRTVVIKRPAPQDAPPIRAGQEVTIRNERRALLLLKGHPVLTELLTEGAFRIGAQSHLYIVVEYAAGVILEEEVLELAKRNERLPELELLVIVDALLDLLQAAHGRDVVYNDVDAKHLFWNRDAYQLKVIDWGNAVFLEGDEVTPQGVSRQSDIYQVGELLYFVLTGGQRLIWNGEEVDFGPDGARVTSRLQAIIQRAVHPSLDRRYRDIASLRNDLSQYRLPLERDRDRALDRIEHRLQRQCNQRDLERLLEEARAVQARDPGFPRTRAIRQRIEDELHRLAVLADLDAARIYLESANWPRAIALLQDVLTHAPEAERSRVQLLLDCATMIEESGLRPPPAGAMAGLEALFAGDPARAAHLLLVVPEHREEARQLQWLMAEHVQVLVPDVMVLRPHLLRLRVLLRQYRSQYARDALESVDDSLQVLEQSSTGLLREVLAAYQQVAESMSALAELLESDSLAEAAASARRASQAAHTILEQLQVASGQATANPVAARTALVAASDLDPVNPVFDSIQAVLDSLQTTLRRLADYRPQANAADLDAWLGDAMADLQSFVQTVPDPRLGVLIGSLQDAQNRWGVFQRALVTGNRREAVGALQRVADAVRRLNPELTIWLNNARGVLEKAHFVQRHALNAPFGRAMADGWTAWDRGSGIEAERYGKQALEEITNELEAAAANRLIRLGKLLRGWFEGHGEGNPGLTQEIDSSLLALLTEEEDHYWRTFTEQMPSAPAYLNAMGAGLIQHYEETSTAAQRVLFFHYVLRGVLEMYEGNVEDADFWQAAAKQSLPKAEGHIAYMALNNVIRDRQAVLTLAGRIEAAESVQALLDIRREVERSTLLLILGPLAESLAHVERALPSWERGDFREAGELFEAAQKSLAEGEGLAHIQLPAFRAWLDRLYQSAAELSVTRQRIADVVNDRQPLPDPRLKDWHQRLIDDTETLLGDKYCHTFTAWRNTYQKFLEIYVDEARRRSRKLRDFDELFNRTPRVDAHPAYGLYRFWRETVESRPEYPAPPTDQPVPQYDETGESAVAVPDARDTDAARRVARRLPRRRILIMGAALVVFVVAAVFLAIAAGGQGAGDHAIAVTWATLTPTLNEQQIVAATSGAIETATAASIGALPSASPTLTSTETPPPSATPTATLTPTDTVVPTLDPGIEFNPTADLFVPTHTPPPTETPVAPAIVASPVTDPLHGRQNILLALEQYAPGGDVYPWPSEWFHPGELSGNWLMGLAPVDAGDNILRVALPPDLLSRLFGPDASSRLRRIETTLSLREYDPALIPAGEVYFGLGLQGIDESRVAVQTELVRQDAINVGARVGDEFRARTTLPVSDARVNVALERYDDGTVGLQVNGQPLGQPRFLTAPNAPVTPFLFVQQGGVVVSVTDLIAVFD